MIVSYRNTDTPDFALTGKTKRGWQTCADVALRKLDQLMAAKTLNDLAVAPAKRLEVLKGDRAGQHAIRISAQWRLCFVWTNNGPAEVEIADDH
jgi:toxin HigB-1